MKNKINDIEWLDTLRALAMLGVIVIHVSTPVLKMTYGVNMEFWWIGNILDSAVRFSVPLFLMLSGATMLGKEYDLKYYYKKRMTRVLIPFLFWLLVYLVYKWLWLSPKDQPLEFYSILKWGIHLFLNIGISKHFWYVYMILFIYLFVPFIGIGLRKLKNSTILFILIGWALLTFVSRTYPFNSYNWEGDYTSKFYGYFLFSGYLVLGYYLTKITFPTFRIKLYASAIFFLSVVSSSVLTYYFSSKAHRLDVSIYAYISINSMIQTIVVFLWVKDSKMNNKFISVIRDIISDYSFGIYLVHILVIDIFFQYRIFWTMAYPLISLPLLIFLIIITSFVIIYILRKIPLGKYVAG